MADAGNSTERDGEMKRNRRKSQTKMERVKRGRVHERYGQRGRVKKYESIQQTKNNRQQTEPT